MQQTCPFLIFNAMSQNVLYYKMVSQKTIALNIIIVRFSTCDHCLKTVRNNKNFKKIFKLSNYPPLTHH
jgi:hypothetical protein